ncbi:MAG: hypothetical protein WDN44_06185 [Sphingomonas sp.]
MQPSIVADQHCQISSEAFRLFSVTHPSKWTIPHPKAVSPS